MEEQKLVISKGNSKIGNIPNVSLSPLQCKNVPCRGKCYAMKSFKQYPNVRKAWEGNSRFYADNPEYYFFRLREYLYKSKPLFFRWHVAGDIPDQYYLDNMVSIARANPGTRFLAYTKCHGLNYDLVKHVNNLTVIFSYWPEWGIVNNSIPAAFYLLYDNPDDRFKGYFECPGSCTDCKVCWNLKPGETVAFPAH